MSQSEVTKEDTNIFNVLDKVDGGGNLGYTLSTLTSLLNSLDVASTIINGGSTTTGGGGGGGSSSRVSTTITPYSSNYGGDSYSGSGLARALGKAFNVLDGYYDSQGFVLNGYLAQISLKSYGAFVVTATTDGETRYGLVSVPIGGNQMHEGIDITGNSTYLANENMDYQKYKGIKKFVYGFAVDVDKFVLSFFKKYYPLIKWNSEKIKKLMYERCLVATIKINGVEITALVTVHNPQAYGTGWNVFIPCVLLLLGKASKIASVYVKLDNKTLVVGDGDLMHTYSSLSYDENTGEVSFGPSDVEANLKDGSAPVEYAGCSLTSGEMEKKGSVRFFFNYDKKDLVSKTLGTIPELYYGRLFNRVKDTTSTKGDLPATGDLTEACNKLSKQLHDNLKPNLIEKAEEQAAAFETSGRWESWNTLDGKEGASIGRHKMSSKAGTVYDYLVVYQSLGGQVSDGFIKEAKDARQIGLLATLKNTYSSAYVDGNKMLPYKEEFTRQSRTDAGKNAQLIVYFESKKGECIIKWYNELKCSTALELSSIMGAVNSWQNNMDVVYGYYKDVIMGASSLNEKAELIERCHMAANFVRKFKSSNYEGVKLKDLDPNCQRLAKWRGRHSKMLNWALNGFLNNWG